MTAPCFGGCARRTPLLAAFVSLTALAGCGGGAYAGSSAAEELPPLLGAGAGSIERPSHAPGDVYFMTGMIPHHAQAVRMAALVPDRSTHDGVRVLAERMAVAQDDEIGLMRQWLADVGEEVPPADATHMRMTHDGVVHEMLMPGMLTEEEFEALGAARGDDFDRLFLTLMIRHHEGAIIMIDELFSSPGAGQDDFIFKLASDMYADQTTEIHFMREMLSRIP